MQFLECASRNDAIAFSAPFDAVSQEGERPDRGIHKVFYRLATVYNSGMVPAAKMVANGF